MKTKVYSPSVFNCFKFFCFSNLLNRVIKEDKRKTRFEDTSKRFFFLFIKYQRHLIETEKMFTVSYTELAKVNNGVRYFSNYHTTARQKKHPVSRRFFQTQAISWETFRPCPICLLLHMQLQDENCYSIFSWQIHLLYVSWFCNTLFQGKDTS